MSQKKVKILILTADPGSLVRLRLGEEVRLINQKMRHAEHREQFEVVTELAVRRKDIIDLLLLHRPDVVHFSGHGSKEGEIFLVSENDRHLPLDVDALKAILTEFRGTVRLVFLNACFSRIEAEAISDVIDCAVGSANGISDRAAITFAAQFYSALGFGRTIGDAFNLGKAQLKVEKLEEEAEIELFAKPEFDPYRVRLIDLDGAASPDECKPTPEIETDPTGRVYLSYAPSRLTETRLIAAAMQERGIPLCPEALAEDRQHMEAAVKEVLVSAGTASGLLALTSESIDSQVVKNVELPAMLARMKPGNSFFIVPAQFSGVELGDLGAQLHSNGVRLHKVPKKKPGPTEAAEIARLILDQRIAAIHKYLPASEPLSIELYTRAQASFKQGTALLLDWTNRFKPRYATPEDWDQYLLPALRDVVQAIEANAAGRAVRADGRLSLPAAIALGCAFVQPKGVKVQWAQHTLGRPDQLWSINAPKKPSDLRVDSTARQPEGSDLAVLVSVTNNVEPDFEANLADLPSFRALVRVWAPKCGIDVLANPGQAAFAAKTVSDAVKAATNAYRPSRAHLFMAVPAGLAMMIGQLLNTMVSIQTYDLDNTGKGRRYRPAALLRPND